MTAPARRPAAAPEPELNVLNLIDVMFLLLVFLLFQPFKAEDLRLKDEMPEGGIGPGLRQVTRIIVEPDGTGALYTVAGRRIEDPARLAGAIREAARGDAESPVLIAPSPRAPFRCCLAAFDACVAARMRHVSWEGLMAASRPPRVRGATP